MFSISKFEEYCGIFEEDDFSLSAMEFFRLIGHTLSDKPDLIADDINYCIYFDLGFNYRFMPQELECFSFIKNLSLLFQLNDDVFDLSSDSLISYYAIEISAKPSERSHIAHAIHNAFAKQSENCTVILFRNYSECMLSLAYGKENVDSTIYLSDWINTNSDVNYIEKVLVYNLSFLTSIEFISDLVYYSAREYYINNFSTDYNSQFSNKENYSVENRFNNAGVRELNGDKGDCIKSYGYDYVETDVYQTANIDENDLDFELLELELDEIEESNVTDEFKDFDEEYDDFSEDEIKTDQIDISGIEESVLDNPIELLEWIKNNKIIY